MQVYLPWQVKSIVDSIISELEDAFSIEIDAEYVTEENFGNKDCIITLIKKLTKK